MSCRTQGHTNVVRASAAACRRVGAGKMSDAMICLGSDGSGYILDKARICAVCGCAFPDVSRTPIHFSKAAEGLDWSAWDE